MAGTPRRDLHRRGGRVARNGTEDAAGTAAPPFSAFDTRGVDVSEEAIAELLRVDVAEWKAQLPQFREYLAKFANLPPELEAQIDALEERLG